MSVNQLTRRVSSIRPYTLWVYSQRINYHKVQTYHRYITLKVMFLRIDYPLLIYRITQGNSSIILRLIGFT